MHYREIEKRLFLKFKADNSGFLTVATVVTVILFPALLLFLPLPGYFLMEPPLVSWQFTLTMTCYLLVIFATLIFHRVVVKPRYFIWALDTFGKHQFYRLYIITRIRFCWPLLALPLVGFKEVSLSVGAFLQLALSYFIMILVISACSYRTLVRLHSTGEQRLSSNLSMRFVSRALLELKLRLGIAVLISVLLAYLLYNSEQWLFSASVMGIGSALLVPLILGCSRFLYYQLHQYRVFFVSLSATYYNQQKYLFCSAIALLWTMLLILPISTALF